MKYTVLRWGLYYLLITLSIYFLSDLSIFPHTASSYQDKKDIIKLKLASNKSISALYLPKPNANYTVLFSHGNAEDLGIMRPYLNMYRDQGFSIFAYDYPGYGTSDGIPTEKKTYQAINAAYDYLVNDLKIPSHKIILHGRSLGTGPTLDLASRISPAAIILESPFLTAFRVVTVIPIFPIDKYRNNKKITMVDAPILFIHGEKDEVIPFWHTKKLFEIAHPPKYFYTVKNANHNDLVETAGKEYWRKIQDFIAMLQQK